MKFFFSIVVCLYSLNGIASPFNGYIIKIKDQPNLKSELPSLAEYGDIKDVIETGFGRFALFKPRTDLTQLALLEISKKP